MTTPTSAPEPAGPPAWRAWPIGARVVVRSRLPGGGYTDALGDLAACDDDGVTVETRRGTVRVAAADIALGKRVPPPPPRRPRG